MSDRGQSAAPPPFTWEAPATAAPPAPSGDLPMTSGDIFQRAVWIYRRGFLVLLAVAAIVQVPLAVVRVVLGKRLADAFAPLSALGPQATPDDVITALQNAFPQAGPTIATIGLVSFVAGLLLSPALIATAGRLHSGTEASVGDSYATALRSAAAILVGSIVEGVVVGGLFVGILLIGIVLAAVVQDAGLAALAFLVALIAAFVVAAYVAIRWAVWSPAVVLEGRGPLDALGRSWRVVRGSMWRTVGILFVTGLVAAVAGAVLGAIGGAIGNALPAAWSSFVPDVLSVLTVSWVPIVLTLLFIDLRARQGAPALGAASPPEASWPIGPTGPSSPAPPTESAS